MKSFLYFIVRIIGMPFFKLLYRPIIIGKENIPKTGPVVLCGNHTNNLDSPLLIMACSRKIHFLAKSELFKGIKKYFIKGMGCIPVYRNGKDSDALWSAIDSLKKGQIIGIFPEGTVNRSKEIILPFKIGAVKMASETNSCIVPFIIKGKYKLFRRTVQIEFYSPYYIKTNNLTKENEKLMRIISHFLKKKR